MKKILLIVAVGLMACAANLNAQPPMGGGFPPMGGGGFPGMGAPADTRTPAQKHTLLNLLRSLKYDYPGAKILGHRDLPWVKKDCPCFDAQSEYSQLNGNQKL